MAQPVVDQVPALGRSAFLGQLYDARRNCLSSGASLFVTSELPPSSITCVDSPSTHVDFKVDESYSSAFSNLDVRGELKLSVLAGLVGLEGSGSYLNDIKQSSRSVRCTLVHRITTQSESINIFHADLKQKISQDALRLSSNATHFVSGIEWGANAFASLEYHNTDNSDKRDIEVALTAKWKDIAKLGGTYKDDDTKGGDESKYSLKVYGDVLPEFTDGQRPKTADDAWQLFSKIKECLKSYNGGKGKQLKFKLHPLSEVAPIIDMKVETFISSFRSHVIEGLERLFDELLSAKQEFNDLFNDVDAALKGFVPRKDMERIKKFKADQVEAQESQLRGAVQNTLIFICSSSTTSSDIQDQEYTTISKLSPAPAIRRFLHDEKTCQLQTQLKWVRDLQKQGIRFETGLSCFLDSIPLQLAESSVFVFLYTDSSRQADAQRWESNWRLFCDRRDNAQLKNASQSHVLIVLRLQPEELQPLLTSMYLGSDTTRVLPRIVHILNGRCVSGDLLADRHKLAQSNLMKSSNEPIAFLGQAPNSRKLLRIRCPGSFAGGSCPDSVREWVCERCTAKLEFGCDGYFYCKCGQIPANRTGCSFKCCAAEAHGFSFLQFKDDDILQRLLEEMQEAPSAVSPREINILLLGETGVGKSSFVNAFAQYAQFESADLAKDLAIQLVPMSISLGNSQYSFGDTSDANEVNEVGQSATQHCRSYVFHIGDDIIIRLIDTPGLGDTRGFKTDQANVRAMVSFLSYYENLHGICVMLKPNNTRLVATFKFCFQELLCHLHKRAGENVVFVYTYGHTTRFKPGSTSKLVRKMLNDANINIAVNERTEYVVDNEPLLQVLMARQGYQLSKEEREDCCKGWRDSVDACDRLLKHIMNLKAHSLRETLRVNNAQDMVEGCSETLARLLVTLQKNKEELGKCKSKQIELQKRVRVVEYETKVVPARDGPVLVCRICEKKVGVCEYNVGWFTWMNMMITDGDIIKSQHIGSILHNPPDQLGLLCDKCNCRVIFTHERRDYQVKTVEKEVVDQNVEDQLQKTDALASHIQKRARDLQDDEAIITQVSVKFSSFLKENSLKSYNDQVEDYLEHQIANENDASVKIELEHTLESYKRQVEMINNSTSEGSSAISSVTLDDIHLLVEKLSSLKTDPNFGQILKKRLETFGRAASSNIDALEEKHIYIEKSTMNALASMSA